MMITQSLFSHELIMGDIYNHSSGGNGKNIAEHLLRFTPNVTHHAIIQMVYYPTSTEKRPCIRVSFDFDLRLSKLIEVSRNGSCH